MPILSAIGAGFGSDKWNQLNIKGTKPLIKPLSGMGVDTLNALRTGAKTFADSWNAGTPRQTGLMGEQEDTLRSLLNRRMANDPNQLLRDVGGQVMSWIDPNVVNPLSKFDVNMDTIMRRARGLNPAAIDSTAERLRNARIASGRYYDTARTLAPLIPSLYNQVYNAGVNNDEMAAGYIPDIMSGWRTIDRAPLVPLNTAVDLTNAAAGNVGNISDNLKKGIFGYVKDRNTWDRLGAMDASMWNSLQEAVQMASSVAGMVGGGGLGGMLGGMGGGGGGGGRSGGGSSGGQPPQPSFLPQPSLPSQSYGTPPGGYSPYNWPPQSQVAPYAPQYPQAPVSPYYG